MREAPRMSLPTSSGSVDTSARRSAAWQHHIDLPRHFKTFGSSTPECAVPSHLWYLLRAAQRGTAGRCTLGLMMARCRCQLHGCAQGAKCLPHQSLWPLHCLGAVALLTHRIYQTIFMAAQ